MGKEGLQQPAPYPAEKDRGGETILRTRMMRVIFVAGSVGAVVLDLVLVLSRR